MNTETKGVTLNFLSMIRPACEKFALHSPGEMKCKKRRIMLDF
jgi:hypothetical protein